MHKHHIKIMRVALRALCIEVNANASLKNIFTPFAASGPIETFISFSVYSLFHL